jgi:3-deoxy-D-manno-octulosonate 8-phosphate phosphatase (KDO 8-P phosphatase)
MPAHNASDASAIERARRIRLIVFDVDGVLTDGSIWLFPAVAGVDRSTIAHAARMEGMGGYAMQSASLVEAKAFHAHDGTGVSLARLAGIECAIITKRISEAVALRARDMRIKHLYQGTANKVAAVHEILNLEGLSLDQVAYLGDDIIDLPALRVCGLAMAVADGRPQVRAAAHWIAPANGGRGAARDAIEFILTAQGKLETSIETYIAERSQQPLRVDE